MWSPEPMRRRTWRASTVFAIVGGALMAVAGCTVEPLYMAAPSPSSASPTGSIGSDLSTIAVKPVGDRVAQQVRNHLIFLFGGGKGQPASPRYSLALSVIASSEPTTNIQINNENEPSSAILTAYATYVLTDAGGQVFSQGSQQFQSSYDVPRQEFAAVRARIDAEDRAARELAELVQLAVAQDLKRGPHPPPSVPAGRTSLFKLGCEDACSPSQPSPATN
jgi:LPS-assembly lipoprotein